MAALTLLILVHMSFSAVVIKNAAPGERSPKRISHYSLISLPIKIARGTWTAVKEIHQVVSYNTTKSVVGIDT